ncbi:hypothetical protein SDC9_172744 [bioreactor metagenome]|uniref:Uncharacterized protein n=1 Tax=bioreactor metagenome TaxID=1076179 RepID=A0A645GF66_9ZZZZ
MEFAVFEFRNPQFAFDRRRLSFFLHRLNLAVHLFVAGDFVHDDFGDFAVFVQEVDDRVAHRRDHRAAHVGVAEFVFGLRLENGVAQLDRDRAGHAVAHVVGLEALAGEFVDRLEHPFLERRQVGSAVVGVLPVDEAVRGFAVIVAVGQREFDGGAFVGDHRINLVFAGLGFEQVLQPPARQVKLSVEVE